ncbi:DNA ligase (ATP) [Strigomonas culicis]|uniref:DNA ligase (ATP) n=1 Tax=Strigomonas culicis TaxID=28005 RepID=S9VSY0_9TRYP|nr:DNA ligase (ATP) [Strigomonas culicis]|eukprot:EPY26315.1 DNA ligase (ATP) [Strigomonas culicis]
MAHEALYVSPKLDGIRCVVGYDKKQKAILFFSRAGTLFECCDANIEPALRYLFEHVDPHLVLDGELYNSSANDRRVAACPPAQADASALGRHYAAQLQQRRGRAARSADEDAVTHFEALVSAIRTTREKRTPEVVRLQQQLQYHIFDVLYASHFPARDGANVCFSARHAFLRDILTRLQAHNRKAIRGYDERVLQLVPAVPCVTTGAGTAELTAAMEANIRAAMAFGYEGLMLRREAHTIANAKKSIAAAAAGKTRRGSANHTSAFGGYEHGKRSSCLLKYKKMQDAEFTIVSAVEGKGKLKGSLGAFVCELPKTRAATKKRCFYVTPATSEENKRHMWRQWKQRQPYKGKALTVQYQDLSKDGIPRFPVGKCIRGGADGKDWL